MTARPAPVPDAAPDDPPDPQARALYAELVLRHSADAVVITDAARRTLWVNEAFTALSGYTLADMLDKEPGAVLQGPQTDRATIRQLAEASRHRREVRVEVMNYSATGMPYWVDLRMTPVHDRDGRHTHFVTTLRDITERKALEDQNEAMRQAETMRQAERQLLAQTSEWLYSARSSDELMMVVRRAMHTLIPEADGALYIYADARDHLACAASWGTNPDFAAQIGPEDCWALRRGRAYSYGLRAIEFPCDHARDTGAPFFCLPIIAHGETIGLLHLSFEGFEDTGLLRAMREQVLRNRWEIALICAEQISLAIANVRLRQQLHEQSVRDPLTGLWNRRWFHDAAARAMGRAGAAGAPVSLISVDVDHFKRFNDDHGHDAGDRVLAAVGALLQDHFTPPRAPCRLGGEEFLVLCPDTSTEEAQARAGAFLDALRGLQITNGAETLPQITASAGVASHPAHGATLDAVMKAADSALYTAKAQGRDRVIEAPERTPRRGARSGPPRRGG